MSKFQGPHNVPNKGKIPKILAPVWTKKRCWHGEDVVMAVFAENVPDGSAVELRIYPKGSADLIDTVTGLKLALFMVSHKYTINWKDKLPKKHGQEFVFKAVIGKLTSEESAVLLVDVEPPALSA